MSEEDYKKAYEVELQARKNAELLLEKKTKDLFEINQELLKGHSLLEIEVLDRTNELLKAKKQAEELAYVKSEFLSMMSHEIKTPLNAIHGYAQLAHDEEDNGVFIENILSSSQVLINTINDILLYSKIESGKLETTISSLHLEDEMAKVLTIFGVIATEKNIQLSTSFCGVKSRYILSDKQKIIQILLNLVGNSCKFTENGTIHIKSEIETKDGNQNSAKLKISVIDSGIGIPENVIFKLFEPFVQVEDSGQFLYEGTGLGLTITKRLLEIMGGTISVKSKLGEGSIFTILLDVDLLYNDGAPDKGSLDLIQKSQRSKKAYQHKVLVVEDNKINQVLILRVLKRYAVEADLASNGQEALDLFRKDPNFYDLIFMDVRMPVMDGYTASRIIRDEMKEKNVKIIALSANQFSGTNESSIERVFNDFIIKPFRFQELEAIFNKYPL